MAAADGWELFYWAQMKDDGKNHMIGRGEFVRLLFELAGVPYVDHGVMDGGAHKVFKFVRGGENVDFPVFAPPAIKRGSFVLSQTPAIMKFLGKEFGFYPTDVQGEAHADSLMAFVTDFVAEGRLVFHPKCFTMSYFQQMEEAKPHILWFETERLPAFLTYLESALAYNAKSHAGGFMVGASLTYVDVAVFHTLTSANSQFFAAFKRQCANIPRLLALRAHVASLPRVAAYLASARRGLFEGNSMM